MSIFHCSVKSISRKQWVNGEWRSRSAVAAAAYRSCSRLYDARTGVAHDYSRRQCLIHSELVFPDNVENRAHWSRERIWNEAEGAEKRVDARVAREVVLALPHELTKEQQIQLALTIAVYLANLYKTVVDVSIHRPADDADSRNVHVHLQMATRMFSDNGLGQKTIFEREDKWLNANRFPTAAQQVEKVRQEWEHLANLALSQANLDERIDHRSFERQNIKLQPTRHVGPSADAMAEKGVLIDKAALPRIAQVHNEQQVRAHPEEILRLVANQKSVFNRRDIARALHRLVGDAEDFQNLLAAVLTSQSLVKIPNDLRKEIYTTRNSIESEYQLLVDASELHQSQHHRVSQAAIDKAMAEQDVAIKASQPRLHQTAGLSEEQRHAIAHVTDARGFACLAGIAGSGKSTIMSAARRAWTLQGYEVVGLALAGKAAKSLAQSSGMPSTTIASMLASWKAGHRLPNANSVIVIDESGMVPTVQMQHILSMAKAHGAKVVAIGDSEQLQPVAAGAPFRALTQRFGFAELTGVRRQRDKAHAQATRLFAAAKTQEGLHIHREDDNVRFEPMKSDAIEAIVSDYFATRSPDKPGETVILAHKRDDVALLNTIIRDKRIGLGEIATGKNVKGVGSFKAETGKKEFSIHDRVVFLRNDIKLDVKNGDVGTITRAINGRVEIMLDEDQNRKVVIDERLYDAVDHAYALTVHKSQGLTVDNTLVLASPTMERHLCYVSMSRHRSQCRLYAASEEFRSYAALTKCLSRSQLKENVSDYVSNFAALRGLCEPPEPQQPPFRQLDKATIDASYIEQMTTDLCRTTLALNRHHANGDARKFGKARAAYRRIGVAIDRHMPGFSGAFERLCNSSQSFWEAVQSYVTQPIITKIVARVKNSLFGDFTKTSDIENIQIKSNINYNVDKKEDENTITFKL